MAKRKLVAASVPQLTQTLREITSERAGSMSEAERKDLHELLTVAATALSEDESRKADVAKSAEAARIAKRQRVTTASKDAGARLNMGALQCLKGDVAAKCLAFLRAEDFRSLAQIKCDEVSAGVLRSGVSKACDAIAPYASPPQLMLGSGWQPLAVLEDAMARADSFYASQPRRPWFRLLRVRPLSMVGEAGTPDFESDDDEQGNGPNHCMPFVIDMASYCRLDGPVTVPRPRCECFTTVAAAVVEILRRAPDKLVRHAPEWLGQFLEAFLQPDSSGLGYDGDDVVPTQTRLWLLSAAGFAPAIWEAFRRARLVATVNALADGVVTVRDDGHMKSILAAERVHLLQWRDAVLTGLWALLSCMRREDGSLRDRQCTRVWDYMRCFCYAAHRIHIYLLPPDVMWTTISRLDPDTPIIAWGLSKMSEATMIADHVCDVMKHLARHVPAAARRILSLGGLETCERVMDGDYIRPKALFRSVVKELRSALLEATRPPPEPTQKSLSILRMEEEGRKHTNKLIGWPDDLEAPVGDPFEEAHR